MENLPVGYTDILLQCRVGAIKQCCDVSISDALFTLSKCYHQLKQLAPVMVVTARATAEHKLFHHIRHCVSREPT